MSSDTEEAELYYYADAGWLPLKYEEVFLRVEDISTIFYTSKKLGNPEVVIPNTWGVIEPKFIEFPMWEFTR